MEIALEIVTATLSALEFIKNSKLPSKQQDPKGYHRYKSIWKTCQGFLGFEPAQEPGHLQFAVGKSSRCYSLNLRVECYQRLTRTQTSLLR